MESVTPLSTFCCESLALTRSAARGVCSPAVVLDSRWTAMGKASLT